MKRAFLVPALLGAALMVQASPILAQASGGWKDPASHTVRRITVDDGAQLEVLDYGGKGRPLLLLAGLGNTAHVFDEFAPTLRKKFHVYALTRRGFGASSAPESGYSFTRLADDIVQVMEQLDLRKPLVVGHSFAGEEMHLLGSSHRSKVSGLVYIDAAFNRAADRAGYTAKLRELPASPSPQPADLASMAAFKAFAVRNGNTVFPEAEVRAGYVVNAAGAITGQWQPEPAVRKGYGDLMNSVMKSYAPAPLSVPALAIYAVPGNVEGLLRRYGTDPAIRPKVDAFFMLTREQYQLHAQWFRTFAGGTGQVMEISGPHHLFASNPDEVRSAIEAFAKSLP